MKWTTLTGVVVVVAAAMVVLAGCGVSQATAQTSSEAVAQQLDPMEANSAALGVRQPHHLDVAALTAEQVLDGEHGYRADRFAIIACGPAVERLAEDDEIGARLTDLPEDTVEISVCGLTVDRFDINPDDFPNRVQVVPNGLVELMRLEAKGYETVEL